MYKKIPYVVAILLVILLAAGAWSINAAYTNSHAAGPPQNIVVVEDYSAVEITIFQSDIDLIAKTVWGEARGCSIMEQSAVIWCILNRVDAGMGTIEEVVTAPYQFTGYKEDNPVLGEFTELAQDVLVRWQAEKHCIGDVGRTLPDTYLWFHGDGKHNIFRDAFDGDYHIWDWECLNPYP